MNKPDPHATDVRGGSAIEQAAFLMHGERYTAMLLALVAREVERDDSNRLAALLAEARAFLAR
jgi:hypothetical protein